MGQMMMQGKLQEEITIIDIGFLANGMYYLKITDKRNTAMKIISVCR
ncbi:MAG: hypothetical protein LBG80_11690 [Bacteroidales bacterium]|nr:hypothetical protein [Bacteroidales bacterium]